MMAVMLSICAVILSHKAGDKCKCHPYCPETINSNLNEIIGAFLPGWVPDRSGFGGGSLTCISITRNGAAKRF